MVTWHSRESKQDQWIAEVVFPGRTEPGYFVESGAADGVSACDTLALERYFGWTGILVEPNSLFFRKLQKNRSCLLENACLSEHDGDVDFVEASWFGRIREHNAYAIPENHRENPYLREDLDGSPAQVVRKRAISLASLLDKHGAPKKVDFLSLDAEGSEWFVLKSFPFDRYEFLAIVVDNKTKWEGKVFDTPHAAEIRNILEGNGYLWDRQRSLGAKDDFFLHASLADRLSS